MRAAAAATTVIAVQQVACTLVCVVAHVQCSRAGPLARRHHQVWRSVYVLVLVFP